MSAARRAAELRRELDRHNHLYYVEARPEISDRDFDRLLDELQQIEAKHPELETVPWCLWGHSGGGFWASLMQTLYPDRIVALWFRWWRPKTIPI